MKTILSLKLKTLIFLALISIFVFIGAKYLLPHFIPFILAYWLAKYTYPSAYFLKKRMHLPMSLSAIITLLLFSSIIGVSIFLFFDALINQINIFLTNLPSYRSLLLNHAYELCSKCDGILKSKDGTTMDFFCKYIQKYTGNASSKVIPQITIQTIHIIKKTIAIITTIFIIIFSALLIVLDFESLKELYKNCIFHDDMDKILKMLSKTGLSYAKVQLLIISIISIICTIGLFFSKNSYPLLIGIIIAILDALPLFGSGTILIPWAIIKLFEHNIMGAVILISTYVICQITRQFLESRLLGDTLGLAPIYFAMSLFIGIKLFGIFGVILGPFSVLLIRTLYSIYKPADSN